MLLTSNKVINQTSIVKLIDISSLPLNAFYFDHIALFVVHVHELFANNEN